MKVAMSDILSKFVRFEVLGVWGGLTEEEHAEHVELRDMLSRFTVDMPDDPDHERYSRVLTDDQAMEQWRAEQQEVREGKRPAAQSEW